MSHAIDEGVLQQAVSEVRARKRQPKTDRAFSQAVDAAYRRLMRAKPKKSCGAAPGASCGCGCSHGRAKRAGAPKSRRTCANGRCR